VDMPHDRAPRNQLYTRSPGLSRRWASRARSSAVAAA
jgi:hypothetical protein